MFQQRFDETRDPRGPRETRRPFMEPTQRECNNLFCGMDTRFLAEAFNVNEQLARKLRNENDVRGNIVRVEGNLQLVRPPRTQQERQEQLQRERGFGRRPNGLEETYCSARIIENIGDPTRADVFVPEAGHVRTVNSHNLPILERMQLSASHVVLRDVRIFRSTKLK